MSNFYDVHLIWYLGLVHSPKHSLRTLNGGQQPIGRPSTYPSGPFPPYYTLGYNFYSSTINVFTPSLPTKLITSYCRFMSPSFPVPINPLIFVWETTFSVLEIPFDFPRTTLHTFGFSFRLKLNFRRPRLLLRNHHTTFTPKIPRIGP